MIMKAFTMYSLASDLDNTAPGFGVTVGYEILEGMTEMLFESNLPADLKQELEQLAKQHGCEFNDWSEHRFVQFVKPKR